MFRSGMKYARQYLILLSSPCTLLAVFMKVMQGQKYVMMQSLKSPKHPQSPLLQDPDIITGRKEEFGRKKERESWKFELRY